MCFFDIGVSFFTYIFNSNYSILLSLFNWLHFTNIRCSILLSIFCLQLWHFRTNEWWFFALWYNIIFNVVFRLIKILFLYITIINLIIIIRFISNIISISFTNNLINIYLIIIVININTLTLSNIRLIDFFIISSRNINFWYVHHSNIRVSEYL